MTTGNGKDLPATKKFFAFPPTKYTVPMPIMQNKATTHITPIPKSESGFGTVAGHGIAQTSIWQHDPAVGNDGGFAESIKPAKNASYSELDGMHVARAVFRPVKVVKSVAIKAKRYECNIRPRNVAEVSRNVAIP